MIPYREALICCSPCLRPVLLKSASILALAKQLAAFLENTTNCGSKMIDDMVQNHPDQGFPVTTVVEKGMCAAHAGVAGARPGQAADGGAGAGVCVGARGRLCAHHSFGGHRRAAPAAPRHLRPPQTGALCAAASMNSAAWLYLGNARLEA